MMKKNFLISTLTAFIFLSQGTFAQNYDLKSVPPLDPKIKTGVLPNGMKYYIRSNNLPEKRAEFYIVHNVGAMQEDDDQNGLAHFTEHMAFNGTQNFPKKELTSYLESIGVKFGQNVNARTDLDQTIYNISDVPLLREGIIDSVLLILHDWSNYISFEPDEVDAERGVILEEWRGRNSASQRMDQKLREIYYKNSKYAKRNVIGDTAVINHFKQEAIKNFYHKWYRPDLQALVIVGDFDAAQMEEKVKRLFSKIPKVDNPSPKTAYTIPDNAEPLIGIATDKEADRTEIKIIYKHDPIKNQDKNLGFLRASFIKILINSMLQERMSELSKKENSPFISAYCAYTSYTISKDAFFGYAQARDNESMTAFKALLTEIERMKRFGFTASEFERAKANLLRSYDAAYAERNKRKNNQLVWPIIYHYLQNNPACDIGYEYGFAKSVIPDISLDEINLTAQKFVRNDNIIVILTGPEKPGITMPNEQEIKAALTAIKDTTIDTYIDKIGDRKLIEKEPVAGKITKVKKNKELGATEWTLSNGIRVILKPTDFKDDELLLYAYSFGGESLLPDEDIPSARLTIPAIINMGIGDFSVTDLNKLLAGKRLSVSPWMDDNRQGFNGRMSPKDFETGLQLIYLYFTHPRWNEKDYNMVMDKVKSYYINIVNDPRQAFSDSVSVLLNNHNKRYQPFNSACVNEVSFDKIKRIYNDRFKAPGNFTFIFTGKIDPEIARPLVEKYLGSLPAVKNNESSKDDGIRPPKGVVINDFVRENKTPRTSVYLCYTGVAKKFDYLNLNIIRHILELRFTETIREEKGGSYGVGVSLNLPEIPKSAYNYSIYFDTDPKLADELKAIVFREIKKIIENGPTETDLQKAKEYFVKKHQEDMKENNLWQSLLIEYYAKNNKNFGLSEYEKKVNNLTVKTIRDYARKVLTQGNIIQVIMRPKE
jgi:zinc protease